jgi:hypothetical protein
MNVDWKAQLRAIKAMTGISEEGLKWFGLIIQNIGYEQGEIRPGEIGRWDVYYRLLTDFNVPQTECLVMSGLTAKQVAEEEQLSQIEEMCGLDRNSPTFSQELDEVEKLRRMSQKQLSAKIAELEALLA